MSSQKFIGTGVALITPFKNGLIDFSAFENIINHVIAGNINYIVVLGSTGETATLNRDEAKEILDFAIKINDNRVPLVAGNFAGNNTKDLVEYIKSYDFTGIDAILSSSPGYVKPSQEGIFRHYIEMEKASPIPIILYNVPGRTRSNIEWQTTVRLAEYSNKFIGIKEATGDLIQTTRILKNKPKDFIVLSGDDEVALPIISVGGHGVISVIANVYPNEFSTMIRAALDFDFVTAQNINFKLYNLHQWLYIEGNPVGIKSAAQHLGLCSNEVRLPLHPLSDLNYAQLVMEMEKIRNFG